ncbi:LPS export ABC transporter permease LptF [Lysobacter sp. KIS68-7]|uniref:LPS export ABC transporter permease LptF n=1 Tax=Lysobacter sp. KIS68-7 TaxID=2904252 RepID=UPI001E4D456E|nr:LPS export ABC transporter permease LptF [Lysobacter sp. KIS68-7]UHQ19972.1 LPS export ABC transporter permease LptF [Lysobacter sp. KIS68-7]
MPKLDRYLTREFTQSLFATLVVLGLISLGGVFADLLGEIARGKVPAGLLLSQLGLRLINFLPILLPLALMLGLLLALGRLYRDSEMPVLASIGVGPRRLLRPVMWVALPVVFVVAICALWLGPAARKIGNQMVWEANRSLLLTGLEPGRFTALPNNGGVVYVGEMTADGRHFAHMFVHRAQGDRVDVSTSQTGTLYLDTDGTRYLRLDDGFRVEGPAQKGRDFRLMRYARNDMRLPDTAAKRPEDDPELKTTMELLADPRPEAAAQLHHRIAPPFLTLAFALIAVPLSRSGPRQARYGRVLLAFLGYLVAMNFTILGQTWIADGKTPAVLGLWWLIVPLMVFAVWLYLRDGRMARSRWFGGEKAQ